MIEGTSCDGGNRWREVEEVIQDLKGVNLISKAKVGRIKTDTIFHKSLFKDTTNRAYNNGSQKHEAGFYTHS